MGADDVFQDKRMNGEESADALDSLDVSQAGDIDPEDIGAAAEAFDIDVGRDFDFFQRTRSIRHRTNRSRLRGGVDEQVTMAIALRSVPKPGAALVSITGHGEIGSVGIGRINDQS